MNAPRIASLVAVLVVTGPVALVAQERVEAVTFPPLTPDKVVRVHMHGGLRLQGPFLSMTPDRLILLSAGAETTVPIASVDSLWVRGNAAGAGAIVGGVALGAVSFGFFAALCEGLSETGGCEEWGKVALLGVGGAAGGALVGWAIGSAIKKWRLRYARPLRVGLVRQPGGTPGLLVSAWIIF